MTELKPDAPESIDFIKTEQALLRLSRSLLDFWRRYDQQTPIGNISWNEYYYINALRDGPLSLKELAQKVSVKTSSASAMVSKLEQRNMICRFKSQQDRRIIHLQLTTEAKAQLALEWNVYQEFLCNLQQRMPEDEFTALCNLLIKNARYF
ncbi:MarR family transcriptional regulator [Klebsiella indica]|nr:MULTISPECIES: MarR family transcriptional regulator [Klebsiella]